VRRTPFPPRFGARVWLQHLLKVGQQSAVAPNDPAVTSLALRWAEARPGGWRGARHGAQLALDLFRVWLSLPSSPVTSVQDGPGRALRQALTKGWGPLRLMRPVLSVLELPDTLQDYLRGRSRQALRTNIRRADTHGLVAREVHEWPEAAGFSRAVSSARGGEAGEQHDPEWFLQHRGDRWFVVTGGDGAKIAFAAVAAADRDAYLRTLYSADCHPEASSARYLVHTALVSALLESGVSRLWADGPLTIGSGLQYFQRLLGYQCVRPTWAAPRGRHGNAGARQSGRSGPAPGQE